MNKKRIEKLLDLIKDDMCKLGYPIDNDKAKTVIMSEKRVYPEEVDFLISKVDAYAEMQASCAGYEPIEVLQYDYDCFRNSVLSDTIIFKYSRASHG